MLAANACVSRNGPTAKAPRKCTFRRVSFAGSAALAPGKKLYRSEAKSKVCCHAIIVSGESKLTVPFFHELIGTAHVNLMFTRLDLSFMAPLSGFIANTPKRI